MRLIMLILVCMLMLGVCVFVEWCCSVWCLCMCQCLMCKWMCEDLVRVVWWLRVDWACLVDFAQWRYRSQ
ncbi:uncharacterized protein Smp_202490 [Schistosoma mansoni]|uniref:uncharacterized protein n=1 Tax=Schistosoma mansoni TaxID=6183 RepID=UPI00022DC6F0|nr:uncharacterized protein Smp_202490 [Schistosoma mansoni]|eukprot:XP_018651833.1 uncharacterized protein Smp_202490 [Schistosoma mansoni]